MKRKPTKKPKYPYLDGCYVPGQFHVSFTRQDLGRNVHVVLHKGHIILSVSPSTTQAAPTSEGSWLHGDDFDAVIGMLKDGKRAWLANYRATRRELALRKRQELHERRALARAERLEAHRR